MEYRIFLIGLITLIIISSCNTQINASQNTLTKEDYEEVQQIVGKFLSYIEINKKEENFLSNHKRIKDHQDSFICKSCLWFYNEIHDLLMKKYGMKGLFELLSRVCSLGFSYNVCNDYINLYAPVMYESLIDHYLNGEFICTVTSICKEEHFIVLKADDYAKELLKDKPNVQTVNEIDTEAETWKVLHVSDIHVDFLYKEGGRGKCSAPLCCREEQQIGKLYKEDIAGKWGYVGSCDLPVRTLHSFSDYVFNEVKPDFIIWTGDNPAHDPWTGSQDSAFEATSLITDIFMNKYNYTVPVYPSVGNHETYPNDEFYPYDEREQFLFAKLGSLYRSWLGEEAYETFSRYGYYSKLHPNSNLRIISTNCLLCDAINFNLLKNPTDPRDEVKWLESTLRQAEQNNEFVYLISHIPIGDGFFLDECAKRYQALVDRFSHIIRGQFYGHTHNDEIKMVHNYFDDTGSKFSGVAFIAPSLTTFNFLNPSFRVFEVDSNSKIPKDYLQYRLNITKANNSPDNNPEWEISYRATEHFNVRYLNETEALHNFTLSIGSDKEVYRKALKKYFSDGPKYEAYLNNTKMPRYLSCKFKETLFTNFLKCMNYNTLFLNEYVFVILNDLSGNWFEKLVN